MATTTRFKESQCFVWEITNFSQLNEKLESPHFTALNSKWKMAINPFEWQLVLSGSVPSKCVEISLSRISGKTEKCFIHFDLFLENSKKEYDHFDSFSRPLQYDACMWIIYVSELKKAMSELASESRAKVICYIDSLGVSA